MDNQFNPQQPYQPAPQQPQYAAPQPQYQQPQYPQPQYQQPYQPAPAGAPAPAPAKKPMDKKLMAIICAAVAVVVVIILAIVISSVANSPTTAAKKYMNALVDGDAEAVMEYDAFDYENYFIDTFSEENIEEALDDPDSYYFYYYEDVSDVYDEIAEECPEYDGKIESGKDVYNAFCAQESKEILDKDIEEFEIYDIEEYDSLKDAELSPNYDYLENALGIDTSIKEYFDDDDVTKVVFVVVDTVEDGRDAVESFWMLKIDGKWKVYNGIVL